MSIVTLQDLAREDEQRNSILRGRKATRTKRLSRPR